MSVYPHRFEGRLSRHGVGVSRVIWYTVLFLPTDLQRALPFDRHPRLRVVGEIAERPVEGAWMPTGQDSYWFLVSPAVRRDAGLHLHDLVEMRFRVDDQDRVEVPAALLRALAADADADAAWAALTPGQRRGHAYGVSTAKTDGTVARRIAAVLAALHGRAPARKPARRRAAVSSG